MEYFSQDDIQALSGDDTSNSASVQEKFQSLHKKVYAQLQVNDIELSIVKSERHVISHESMSRHHTDETDVLAVQYLRTRSEAVLVEKLMGREEVASVNNIIIRLHPVIEVRLSEDGICVELLLAPDAWWDQQNLKGKLGIARHRHAFYSTLMKLDPAYTMGFWQGIHLSEMRLAGKYFQHPRIMDDWISTFEPHADWFRVGIWYEPDAEKIQNDHIIATLTQNIIDLYEIYKYLLWTSGNNFREFND